MQLRIFIFCTDFNRERERKRNRYATATHFTTSEFTNSIEAITAIRSCKLLQIAKRICEVDELPPLFNCFAITKSSACYVELLLPL